MERRPEASAHQSPERSLMSGLAHFKSDPGEAHIITQQSDQREEGGREMKSTISKIAV